MSQRGTALYVWRDRQTLQTRRVRTEIGPGTRADELPALSPAHDSVVRPV